MDRSFTNDSSDGEEDLRISGITKHRRQAIESDSESETKSIHEPNDTNLNNLSDVESEVDQNCVASTKVYNEEAINVKTSTISDLYDSESSDECEQSEDGKNYINNVVPYGGEQLEDHKQNRHGDSQRLSAKQAMDQMHKIKSESCRMLREKRFHLPYHRPKQVSLKEIMNKKKIQFIPGQKKLNWRMNQKELEEYARKLEEKEKEMIELCKSDSEGEETKEESMIDAQIVENSSIPDEKTSTPTLEPSMPQSINTSSLSNVEPSLESVKTISNTADNDSQETNLLMENNDNELLKIRLETIDPTEEIALKENNDIAKQRSDKTGESCIDNNEESDLTIDEKDVFNDDELQKEIESYEPSLTDCISSSLQAKPVLTGNPGTFIDLTEDSHELSGVDLLKQKYLYHSKLKTKEEMEREQERKQQPGAALMNFKRDLKNQICKQRLEEWNKKRNEESIMKNEINDELSECEKLLDDDSLKMEQNLNEENNVEEDATESETEIDEEEEIETELPEKKLPKCDYIDDEAESEEDCSDTDFEENNDKSDYHYETISKKRPSRIIKPSNDSDSSDDEQKISSVEENDKKTNGIGKSLEVIMSTPIKNDNSKQSYDLFESEDAKKVNESFSLDSDDYLPLGQHVLTNATPLNHESNTALHREPSVEAKGRPDLLNLVSPLIKLIDRRCVSVENITHLNDETMSENYKDTPRNQEKWINLQKKLFIEPDTIESNTQEIANLCSGKFPTQSNTEKSKNESLLIPLDKNDLYLNTEMTQNTESELLELCSGKFDSTENFNPEQNDAKEPNGKKLDENPNEDHNISSERIIETAADPHKESNDQKLKSIDVLKPLVPGTKAKIATIKSFFMHAKKDNASVEKNESIKVENPIPVTNSSPPRKLIITSSSDEEDKDETDLVKNKKLKTKRTRDKKRVKPLEISDDESDEESSHSNVSSIEEHNYDDDREVNYDSEENEVPFEMNEEVVLKKNEKKPTSEFFDNEAELTSEDEWKGSGDEDERGLDKLEWEEGDADQIDERKVTKELERIHRHQMLDQDIREVKILQDILLEDGDLQGGTRERKFRWKNLDSGIDSGAIIDDENNDETDDVQNEEQWRKQRHERETYLREQIEKNDQGVTIETTFKISSRMSFIAPLAPSISSNDFMNQFQLLKPYGKNPVNGQPKTDENVKKPKDLPSPVKKPFALQKSNFKGFLSRGEASLNRLAVLAKTGVSEKDGETPRNLSLSAPGKKGNFVFTTISPPCNNNMDEDTKKVKRRISENPSTPALVKRMKIAEDQSKFKKSLFDHV